MNIATYSGLFTRLLHRLMLGTRYLGGTPTCKCFGAGEPLDAIQRIYVINLDRQGDRLSQVKKELQSVRDRTGRPLTAIMRRFSAVDARYLTEVPDSGELQPHYSLADQLFVDPHPSLAADKDICCERISMTRQEVAVALSHITVWKAVAASDLPYTLVLEDDVYFRRGFARTVDRVWAELMKAGGQSAAFDLLYLSFKEVRMGADRVPLSELVFRPARGLWYLSGYVLSARGARRLLDLLPVRGPVDLWINHQFANLDVVATQESLIDQRRDCPSANLYSILPVLSRVGVLTRERPQLFKARPLPEPIFAFGRQGSGLTALAMALSMLGYRCCSDVTELPVSERDKLFAKRRGRVFDAYVNIGSLGPRDHLELAKAYPAARFIITEIAEGPQAEMPGSASKDALFGEGALDRVYGIDLPSRLIDQFRQIEQKILILPKEDRDKWELLRLFLGCDYPTDHYPECKDGDQRKVTFGSHQSARQFLPSATLLMSDASPWIAPQKHWSGIRLYEAIGDPSSGPLSRKVRERFRGLDCTQWMLRDDTFPSNLAIFRPGNFAIGADNVARLTLQRELTSVREYTSASICSCERYLYGRFAAEVKPANVPGLITGVFLHRNSPRQEIDVEFLGRDTTKLLVNVYYNPGGDGARMEYGYRGTPSTDRLGFRRIQGLSQI